MEPGDADANCCREMAIDVALLPEVVWSHGEELLADEAILLDLTDGLFLLGHGLSSVVAQIEGFGFAR